MVDALWQDIRYALRSVRLNPGFAAVAVLSLALGSGANSAMFQLLDAVRLRTIPVHAPEDLINIRVDDMTHARGAWLREAGLTNPLWERIAAERDLFDGALAWADDTLERSSGAEIRKVAALWVSGDFFRVLGVKAALGRTFAGDDDRRGCGYGAGVVLSHRFWQQELGAEPSIVGKAIALGKTHVPVVGVAAAGFSGLEVGRTFDVALPICAEPAWRGDQRLDSGTVWWLTVMGRRRPGMSLDATSAQLRAKSASIFAATLPAAYPAASVKPYLAMTLVASPASHGVSRLRTLYSRPLVLLLAITSLVLMISLVNLAHLLMARAHAGRRDLAVRAALGASRARLAQQAIVQTLALAVSGAAAGLVLGQMLCRMLVSFLASGVPNAFLDVSIDGRALAMAALLAVLMGLVLALPAHRIAATPLIGSLRPGGTPDRGRSYGRVLLISQIAVAFVLLAGTLLFVRTLRNLERLDPGFRTGGVVIADLNFADLGLAPERAVAFRRDLLRRLRDLPGVAGAAEGLILPLTGGNWNNRMWIEGTSADRARVIMRNMVGDGYFQALNVPIVAGRDFTERDLAAGAPNVLIVNQAFVRQFSVEAGALGQRVSIESTPQQPGASYEIVGIVGNTKYHDLREAEPPIAYVPLWQAAQRRGAGQFVVRTNARVDALEEATRAVLASLGGVRYSFRRYTDVTRDALVRERLMAALAGPFAALALVLTTLGLYGVFSYWVGRRTREIGVRMAVGAARPDVILAILRETGAIVGLGLAAGIPLALAASRAAGSLLFGLSPFDPLSLAFAAAILAAVAAVASYLPARQAAGVDPAVALRHE